ncbi:uncharacterized metal-binding protein YceD (DUF177 family) [Tepidamorphus gemmatus]|uniref:Uncharacterized metal-binding protein YceD (DUF177 family) n=1 Tax=Tepidamorphus gemmatus TaxID=747076 RepID=A0A4R3MEN7_9HYPH|nr:DUF177 domain-containing protein [Tepidamorphus gemmatus]TCT11483.1 uncharacterized metal-binding protein YceD (DUF177 family) [Tepidamorphus gemmatus]
MIIRDYPVSIPVIRDQVPDSGLDIAFRADAAQCAAFARYLGVPSVERVEAALKIEPRARRSLAVNGHVACDLVQTCVVTLEPVAATIDEVVAIRYVPELGRPSEADGEGAAVDDVETEPLEGGAIDVGALIAQTLSLGLDPYPRRPGVVFEAGTGGSDGSVPSGAFAGLARLRRGDGGS